MAKKPTPAPILATGQFVALGTIVHNGDTYALGQTIEGLTESEADALLLAEAVAYVAPPPEPAAPAA
jgi:hypothetical protein